jgi:alpha-beta hydrolase superfamily lysophospholipase
MLVILLLFSLISGTVVYLFSMTTNHAAFEPKKIMESEKRSILNAHTKDPVIMEPLNEAKEKWIAKRQAGSFEVLSVRSPDGLSLVGYYLDSGKKNLAARKTVILVHGMMDSAAGMAYLFDEYSKQGWAVLAIDLRSHGESEGTKRTMGVREGEDLSLWVNLVLSRFGASEIFLHGVSMGAVAVMSYAADERAVVPAVKGLIVDSCFASHRETLTRLLQGFVGNRQVAQCLAFSADLACFISTGIPFARMETVKMVYRLSLPVLLFHGQSDVLVPISSMRDIFAIFLKRGNEIVVIPSAPHIGTYFYAPELYMSKIENFTGGSK